MTVLATCMIPFVHCIPSHLAPIYPSFLFLFLARAFRFYSPFNVNACFTEHTYFYCLVKIAVKNAMKNMAALFNVLILS